MNEKPSKWKVFTAGIIRENPVLRLVLGCCSALAVTTTVSGAVGMGLAMTFVLICSNIVISALPQGHPGQGPHLPCYHCHHRHLRYRGADGGAGFRARPVSTRWASTCR